MKIRITHEWSTALERMSYFAWELNEKGEQATCLSSAGTPEEAEKIARETKKTPTRIVKEFEI